MSKGHKHYSEEILTLSGFIIKQQSLKINQTSQQNELKVNKAKNIKKEFMKIKKISYIENIQIVHLINPSMSPPPQTNETGKPFTRLKKNGQSIYYLNE